MKRIFMKSVFFIVMLSLMSFVSFSNTLVNADTQATVLVEEAQGTTDIIAAIKKGDASGVAKFFDSRVDIQVDGQNGTYSKAQAEQMLRTFFTKNKVSNFKVVHSVDSPNGSSSSIVGQLNAGGKTYRMYIVFSTVGSKQTIQELNIKDR